VNIEVDALLDGQDLRLRVSNGVAPTHSTGAESVGLRNVRERLQVHFGAAALLQSAQDMGERWLAEIRMPVLRERP
jgi:LytS/YehU family sensor histidine kinase